MAYKTSIQIFEVRNCDVTLRFTCPNHGKRIKECVENLAISDEDEGTLVRKQSFYGSSDPDIEFRLGVFHDPEEGWVRSNDIESWEAFFFENTDYPMHVQRRNDNVKLQSFNIGKEKNEHAAAEDDIIFGAINYKNQVGRTDIHVHYEKDDKQYQLSFSTEVLSYKMDYRSDMRRVIQDIEEEFALLSYSFLKETYLTFRTSDKEPTDLIWWQIFRDCFQKTVDSAHLIIDNPKRRLHTSIRYERAERMPYMPAELENEYEEFKDEPAHLYRMEEMYLSKDTIENRFLKYAISSISDDFKRVKSKVLNVLRADNLVMRDEIQKMDEDLASLENDPFFRGIGTFRGFTQDSLVMKQALGYRDIYEQWITLQCGYDLQEGVMQLEVKDISELYEIWCFLKVKNMVEHILRDKAAIKKLDENDERTEGDFVKTLIQGKDSEVLFVDKENPDLQIVSLMYNATTDDTEQERDESVESKKTDIKDTRSVTTEQRPDIVLRLSKIDDQKIQYTYLFDAKYRIRDSRINGVEVPPVDAINQLHRYRDAIYYSQNREDKLKREVIGGYVLYPGNLNKDLFAGSYYHRSVDEVNIGAFPLKPGGHWKSMTNDILVDDTSSEDVLYHQIKAWLDDEDPQETLLNTSIPQKGLEYTDEMPCGLYLIASVGDIRAGINSSSEDFKMGHAKQYTSGHSPSKDIDILKVKYFAPVLNGEIYGFYKVININMVHIEGQIKQPYRVQYTLGEYHQLESSMKSGVHQMNAIGWTVSSSYFKNGIKRGMLEYKNDNSQNVQS